MPWVYICFCEGRDPGDESLLIWIYTMSYNIIIVAPVPSLPINDGYSYYFMNRIKYLAKKNYKLYFHASISTSSKNINFSELRKFCEELHIYKYDTFKQSLKNRNLKNTLGIITKFWLPTTVSMRFSSKMKKDISCCLNAHKIDVIIIEYPYLLINIPKELNAPVVLSQHNLEFSKLRKRAIHVNFLKKIAMLHESQRLKKYERKNIKNKIVSLYTFISTENKKIFENIFCAENTYLLPPGYNLYSRDQSVYQEGKIVFVGAMNDLQNITAIEWFANKIFPTIIQKNKNVKLYIIGKDPDRKILQLNSENIIVTGKVNSIDKQIVDAHLYILPLLFGDGVKIKTLEAFATGNIVISTSIGVEGTGFISNHEYLLADTEDEFIEKCNLVLSNRKKYEYLAINAMNKIQQLYSWDNIMEAYEKRIGDLMTTDGKET